MLSKHHRQIGNLPRPKLPTQPLLLLAAWSSRLRLFLFILAYSKCCRLFEDRFDQSVVYLPVSVCLRPPVSKFACAAVAVPISAAPTAAHLMAT